MPGHEILGVDSGCNIRPAPAGLNTAGDFLRNLRSNFGLVFLRSSEDGLVRSSRPMKFSRLETTKTRFIFSGFPAALAGTVVELPPRGAPYSLLQLA